MDTEKIIEKMIDKSIVIVKNDFIKKKIQLMIIQPFLQYILELVFPYIVIICVVFVLLITLLISLVILVLRIQSNS
jgi:hypothetical protein